MKIIFHMTSRYPTSKAYGVTTGETARALRELGNEVKIVAPQHPNCNYDLYENEILGVSSPVSIFLRNYSSNIRGVAKFTFVITSILLTFKSIKFINREKPDVIWARDYWAVLLLQGFLPKCRFVVEVHQFPSFSANLALLSLIRQNQTALLAIQKSLKEELEKRYPRAKVFFGPMGASCSFFERGRLKILSYSSRQVGELKVCYLGRKTSSGEDNGLTQLLEDWKGIPSGVAHLTLIGLTQPEINQMGTTQSQGNVTFLPSVSHEDVPRVLSEFDCGIIPYPEGEYHRTRFPIKIVEYCASALNIIANETESNKELLTNAFSFFYAAGDSKGLLKMLLLIKENIQDSQRRAERGFEWAQDYTYQKRLRDIHPFLEGRIN